MNDKFLRSLELVSINGVQLEVGDIVLYRGKGFLSKCVQFFTKSEYSHAAMVVSNDLVIESNWYKISNVKKIKYNKDIVEIYRYKYGLNKNQKYSLLEESYSFLNKWYDYGQIYGYVLEFFYGIKVNPFNSPQFFICSELVDRAYLKIGIDLVEVRVDGDVTPSNLASSSELVRIL
jgi:hypothetical protein